MKKAAKLKPIFKKHLAEISMRNESKVCEETLVKIDIPITQRIKWT
jgi:hypothetical protein